MNDKRIIKKYPNRRLYDTTISKYVTLNDVKHLVIDKKHVQIVDARTKADLTRSVLLQVILEQEEEGKPIMSAEMLEQLIRFYGDPFQNKFASYLEYSVNLIAEQRAKVTSSIEKVSDPLSIMTNLANRNMEVFKDMQEGLFSKMLDGSDDSKKK